MNKRKLRNEVFSYLGTYGENIKTKLNNVCSKTGRYDVPKELFQKRTKRNNRSLISWRTILQNNITFEQLDSFEGGIVVEFVNNDFFNKTYQNNPLFIKLLERLGSKENVSSIITIRTEEGNSSSAIPREAFSKLINNTKICYNNQDIIINSINYTDYAIKKIIQRKGQGNETWSGFLFVSIRGGRQDTIETHKGIEYTLFNPSCDYASEDVSNDLDLVMAYFAMLSIDVSEENIKRHRCLFEKINRVLESSEYESVDYTGNLLEYCQKQYSVALKSGQLTDPIQLKAIKIDNFNIKTRTGDSIDLTHNEAVIHNKFYWDKKKKTILSPARPTNVFWSFHLSNMMQQDYSLDDYFDFEEKRFNQRKELLKK